ncbi:MAG: hemerythrin domain-containing protein [Gammaproteobacteria bacterium]|nr:hemerythrin domain-containing protein [Gammaproteobacteria bacterium]
MRSDVVQSLCDEHRNIERVLLLIRFQAEMLQGVHDLQGFELLTNALGYMHNYPGVTHHPCEEIMLARLPVIHPAAAAMCQQVAAQHKAFANQESAMLRLIREAQAGDPEACARLKETGTGYCTEQAKHITTEELELFPLALKYLSEKDWQEIASRSKAIIDPVFGKGILQHYQSLYDYLMSYKADLGVH